MNEPTLKLPRNGDDLLRDFPPREPDFEAQAQAIQARLKGSPGGVVFDDLLRVPDLPPEAGEPGPPSSARAASAPKSNFAAMARKSVQKSNDDAAALAKELLAATAQSRRPDAEMVERVRAAGRAAAMSTPLPKPEAVERPSGVVARTEPIASAAPSRASRGKLVAMFAGALSLAAAVALFLKSGASAPTSTSAALEAERAADAPAAAAPHAVATGATPPPAKPSEVTVSPEALEQAPQVRETVREAPKAGAAKLAAATGASPVAEAKAAPAASIKQEHVELEEDPEPPQPAPVERRAEAAAEPAMKPAEGTAGSVPLSPSAGAVSTALSTVRSGAQACLAGQNESVTAVVTFAADGHVVRVSASGPSGSCIQAALSKAHIAPFAKESFSATTTIRPP